MVALPKPSATVVLARESDRGPELLLVKRRAGDAFGDSYTFPGGVLDADEYKARRFCRGRTEAEASGLLGDADALDYYSAVTRELFEETGILLPRPAHKFDAMRSALYDGTIAWTDFLAEHDLTIPCDELHYFAHWITPERLPKRWSTRFFIAAAASDIEACPDGSEITECCWLTVDEAIAGAACGDRKLPFPTVRTIEWLRNKDSVAALIDWAHRQQQSGIPDILPTLSGADGERRVVIPEPAD